MRSMTGYGEAAAENGRYAMAVSLKSVNHRFLDLQLRIPEELRAGEAQLREALGGEISRGRVEARVEARPLAERQARVELHMGVVRAAHAAVKELVDLGLVERGLGAGDLLRLPEAFRVVVEAGSWNEADQALLVSLARQALAQLVAGREREGEGLRAIFLDRVAALEVLAERLDGLRGGVRDELLTALRRRLAELLAAQPIDEARLAQEAALQVDRSDVSEEIDRLRAHLAHFRAITAEPGPGGKRLDFLTQEIFRELNTLGAKCRNAEMTRAVLDAKVICEQLREQVQNVE
jgi:uncharacterized protein (TIGR00255 family)